MLGGSKNIWTDDFVERYSDRWEWELLSENPEIPWTEFLIDRYSKLWEWARLSYNHALPWNEILIDRYLEKWNWKEDKFRFCGLSNNKGLPWSQRFYERYDGRWDIKAVARHYDGNVRSLTPEQVDRLIKACSLKTV